MSKMRRTDLDWIEQVPFDWEVKKLKYCFTFGKGLSITKDNLEESGVPVISYGQIHSKLNTGTSVNDSLIRYVNESYLRTDMSALVKKNDFIFADTSEDLEGCGNCVYNDFDGSLFAGYHTIIFRSRQAKAKYFAYLFLTDCWRSQIRKVASGVKLYSITQKILKETSIIIPPLSEQKKIADFLDAKCADIDQIRADIEKQIEILTNYKKSVITEAVTKGLDPKVKLKDSGIEWIGKIPEHWEIWRLGALASKKAYSMVDGPFGSDMKNEEYVDEGVPIVQLTNIKPFIHYTESLKFITEEKHQQLIRHTAESGDIVIAKMMPAGRACILSDLYNEYVVAADAIRFKVDEKNEKRFILYALNTYCMTECELVSKGSTRVRISLEIARKLNLAMPPFPEQKAIASYLDQKCSEIDAAIAEKQKQLETLEEYKKSLIFEYVTGKKEVV